MILYRLTDYTIDGYNATYKLETEISPSVEKCYVDIHALLSLEKLVTGPITKLEELLSIETALRALVFHDSVHFLQPAYEEFYFSSLENKPIRLINSESKESEISETLELMRHANFHGHNSTVDFQIYCFNDDKTAQKYISQYNARKHQILQQEKLQEKNGHLSGIKKTSLLHMDKGNFVHLANSREEYFEDIFKKSETLVKKFLRPIPAGGKPAYLTDPLFKKHIEQVGKFNPTSFFHSLDNDWRKFENKSLKYILKIPISPLLAILLNRASSRSAIPSEIIAMREEFQSARAELWHHLDDAMLRSTDDPEVAFRIMTMIENDAKNIVPRAFRTDGQIFPFIFKFFGRILLSENLGIQDSISDVLQSDVARSIHSVEAANILIQNFQKIEWSNLLSKHFSDAEINHIMESQWS